MQNESIAEIYAKQLAGRVDSVAARLRRLAEDAERAANAVRQVPDQAIPTTLPTVGRASFTGVVADLQHEILWGLANLNLDNLIRDAAEADLTRGTWPT